MEANERKSKYRRKYNFCHFIVCDQVVCITENNLLTVLTLTEKQSEMDIIFFFLFFLTIEKKCQKE